MLLPKVFAVPKDIIYFYDQFPLAAADFSLRKKRPGHTQAVRVRAESGTNAGNDKIIGFDSNGDLDITDLENWCDGGDGFVNQWFDATGNGNDVTQTTASNQPKIVSNGSVVKENGKPALDFDGIDDSLETPEGFVSVSGDSPFSAFHIARYLSIDTSAPAANPIYQVGQDSGDASDRRSIVFGTEGDGDDVIRLLGGNAFYNQQYDTSNVFLGTNIYTGGGVSYDYYSNGSQISSTSSSTGNMNFQESGTDSDAALGFYRSQSLYANIRIQEAIFYFSDQSANRTVIESDINGYFSIY